MDDQEVTEYYHRGVVCHLIGQDLAIPLDVEFQRPGEGEVPAAKRLLERVFANYPRYFDAVVGDGLYFEAPFINFCREHHKHLIMVVKGDHRLLLQDAQGLFSQRAADDQWTEGRRTVQYWDDEGFTSAEGVTEPLRVLHTEETEQRRERIAGPWKNTAQTSSWYWATTFSPRQLPARSFWRAGHWRWDIENGCFNTTSTHWGLDHVFKHEPTAIVNFVLTLFLAFVLLQCFWRRNLKPPFRDRFTLIGLAAELYAALAGSQRRPGCWPANARGPQLAPGFPVLLATRASCPCRQARSALVASDRRPLPCSGDSPVLRLFPGPLRPRKMAVGPSFSANGHKPWPANAFSLRLPLQPRLGCGTAARQAA